MILQFRCLKSSFYSTVLVGSIPELPAKSCKEIKNSAEGRAGSGDYWFDSVVPGVTIPLHCDMETAGK